jgi:CheY-like chemotaxis protein
VIDQQMPVMDGPQAVSLYRQYEAMRATTVPTEAAVDASAPDTMSFPAMPHTPKLQKLLIVAISANSDEECRKKALESGADYFLMKPFTITRFREIMKEYTAIDMLYENSAQSSSVQSFSLLHHSTSRPLLNPCPTTMDDMDMNENLTR